MVLFLDQCFSILEHTCIHSRVGLSITFPRYSIEKCFLSCLSSSCESRWPGKQRTERWATTYDVWKGNNMSLFFQKNMVNIYVLNQPAGPPTAPTAKPGCRPARRGAGRGCQRSAGKRGPGTIQGGVRFAKYAWRGGESECILPGRCSPSSARVLQGCWMPPRVSCRLRGTGGGPGAFIVGRNSPVDLEKHCWVLYLVRQSSIPHGQGKVGNVVPDFGCGREQVHCLGN